MRPLGRRLRTTLAAAELAQHLLSGKAGSPSLSSAGDGDAGRRRPVTAKARIRRVFIQVSASALPKSAPDAGRQGHTARFTRGLKTAMQLDLRAPWVAVVSLPAGARNRADQRK